MPSNEVRPTAGLTARFMAPTPPEKVPAVRLKRTPVVCSGSMISMSQPVLPFSSPTMMLPHGALGGVARDGPGQDRLDRAIVEAHALDPGLGRAFLVAEDEVGRGGVIRPERHHVDVGAEVR